MNDILKLLEKPLKDGQEVRIMRDAGDYRVIICGDCHIESYHLELNVAVAEASADYVQWFDQSEDEEEEERRERRNT